MLMSVATILTCGFLFLGGIALVLALDFGNLLFWIGFALIFMGLVPLVFHWGRELLAPWLRTVLTSEDPDQNKGDSHEDI